MTTLKNSISTFLPLTILAFTLLLSACSSPDKDNTLIIYSGRSKALVEGLVSDYREQSDINVEVRYGNDAELMSLMQEEGEKSPADVFWANTTGALGAATRSDMLTQLPDSLLQIPSSYTPSSGLWLPITSRFRVLAYNTNNVDESDLPSSVLDLPEHSEFKGKVGWTPSYSSFYDFMTALRDLQGDESARSWAQDMQDLNPKNYSSNTPMIQALASGEIDVALTNHYYVLRMKYGGAEGEYEEEEHEEGEEGEEHESEPSKGAPVATYHFEDGDVGNLALVTGAGVLNTTNNKNEATKFLRFLLSKNAQQFAANQVHEYPAVQNVELPEYMLPAERAINLSPDYDYEKLSNLEPTLKMLRDVGLN